MGTQLCRSFSSQASSHPKQFKIKMRPTYILDDDSPVISLVFVSSCVSFHLFLLLVCFLASVCILLPTLCFSCNHCVSFSFVSCLSHFSSLFSSLFRLFYIFLQALSFSCYQQSRLHRNGGYQ